MAVAWYFLMLRLLRNISINAAPPDFVFGFYFRGAIIPSFDRHGEEELTPSINPCVELCWPV